MPQVLPGETGATLRPGFVESSLALEPAEEGEKRFRLSHASSREKPDVVVEMSNCGSAAPIARPPGVRA
jgi:hypothetical protein